MLRIAFPLVLTACLASDQVSAQSSSLLQADVVSPTPAPGPDFGELVDVSGDVMVATAYTGGAFVFERIGGVWSEVQALGLPAAGAFGRLLSIDGTTIVYGEGLDGGAPGFAWVYVKQGAPATWVLQKRIAPLAGEALVSLALAGDRLALGVRTPGGQVVDVYERSGSNWALVQTLDAPPNAGQFGRAVAMDGDVLVVGGSQTTSDFIFVYEHDGAGWNYTSSLTQPTGLGTDIAVSGERIMTASGSLSGSVHFFKRKPGGWAHEAEFDITASTFSRSFDICGDLAAVGTSYIDEVFYSPGSVQTYSVVDGAWQVGPLLSANAPALEDHLGYTVALDSNGPDHSVVVAGAPGRDVGAGAASGAIFVFESVPPPMSYCGAGTSALGCSSSLSAEGPASQSMPSGFEIGATGLDGSTWGLLFFGTNGRQANPWGNGTSLQCVVPPVRRTGVQFTGGTQGQCDGALTLEFNAWMDVNPSGAPALGDQMQVQAWFRDPTNTSNQTTSLSDALEFIVSL